MKTGVTKYILLCIQVLLLTYTVAPSICIGANLSSEDIFDYLAKKNINNEQINQLRNRWVLLYFWTPRSQWSVKGLDVIAKAQFIYGDSLTVIALECYKDRKEQVYHNLSDSIHSTVDIIECNEKSHLFKYLGIKSFPARILINKKGNIIDFTEGEGFDGFPKNGKSFLRYLRIKTQ